MAGRMLPTISRLKSLVREKVKPVPAVDIRQITLGVDPIVVAEIRRGDNPLYAALQNQIYVRRGATSRFADPTELRSLITSTDFNLNSGILSNY
jgi:predicted HTH transcriptional regulator